MTYTYTWANAEQTMLSRDDGWLIPAEDCNRFYIEFLASGAVAADYVAPSALPEPTAEEKLKAAGLSAADLVALLEQESGVNVADLKAAAKR